MAPGSCILANPENCDYLAEAMENEKKPTIIRLTKEFTFEAAHALEGYDGLCREIHGHSYRLFVTVKGTPCADESNPKFGMVMDFGELKRIVNEQILSRLDHAFVMRRTAESTRVAEQIGCRFGRIVLVDYQPTCENARGFRRPHRSQPAVPCQAPRPASARNGDFVRRVDGRG